jgi:hypothetical protein
MTVDVFARERWNATGAYLEAGVAYELKAHGEWVDHGVTFSAAGDEAPGFHLHDVSRFASAVLGDLESLYKSLAKQQNVDFWWTRRVETEPWLALMGFVASDLGANDQTLPLGETFEIGEATTFSPRSGGYLYCFANDAWQTYNNNRGSVSLTIARRPG